MPYRKLSPRRRIDCCDAPLWNRGRLNFGLPRTDPKVAARSAELNNCVMADRRTGWCAVVAVTVLFGGRALSAQQSDQPPHATLGQVNFAISCAAEVKADFNRGVALLHHMTYPLAREVFERVAATDSTCAMAHWGVAMTLFQPLWPTRPTADDLRRGWQAVKQAKALVPGTERERVYLLMVEAFFEPGHANYWQRIKAWAEATAQLNDALPHDEDAAALHALALLATARSDTIDRTNADRAAELLVSILDRNPEHPAAMHYLIHANDVPGREQQQLEIVRRYETIAPRNPHALHMPTHIYVRTGDWDEVINGNLKAADAALAHPAGEYVWDEFPHAVEYLVYAELQKGADTEAREQLKRLQSTSHLEPTFKTAFHLASTAARFALERRAWQEAAALRVREPATLDWDRFTWPEAVTWFARGLGALRLGRIAEAMQARDHLAELQNRTTAAGEALFARNIQILSVELQAWLAHTRQQNDSSVMLLQKAAVLEAATPKHAVTPAPTLPALELLGDLLLEQGRPAEALDAYRRSLEQYPRRFNSLIGAARAARAAADATTARSFYRELLETAVPGGREVVLREAQAFAN